MSSLTDMVLMPGADYQDICNAVREKSGGTEMLKSGEIAAIIRAISGTVSDLGAKLYTFGAISDAHMPYGNGPEDFRRAIPVMGREGAEFIVHAGDIGMNSAVSELETWQGIVSELATVPVYSCNGNHDLHANNNWLAYVGHDLNHVFERDGDVFILLSITSTTWATPYGADTIQWMRQQLALYAGRRIFLVTHLPLPGYAGLRPNTYYGFSAASTEDDEILALINSTKNVIHLSGHTHFYFEVEERYDGINAVELNNSDSAIVHIPSLNYPRTADNTADNSGSQGYIVNVYERGVVLKAYDFIDDAYLDGYEYHLPIRNGKTDVSNVIVVSDTSITVAEGGSATFGVRLMLAPVEPVTVALSVDNGLVSLDKTELVFSPENYAQEQTVAITAPDDDATVDVSSAIEITGAQLRSAVVSVTIDDTDTRMWAVTNNLTGATTSNATAEVVDGSRYEATITVSPYYDVDSVVVTMGGVDVTATAYVDGSIVIPAVTGDVVITVLASFGGTNQIPISTDVDGAPYNGGKGFKENVRISGADGAETAATGFETTGFIPCTPTQRIYFANIGFGDNDNERIIFYDAARGMLGNIRRKELANLSADDVALTDTSLASVVAGACASATMTSEELMQIAFIRVTASHIDGESIITIDEPLPG